MIPADESPFIHLLEGRKLAHLGFSKFLRERRSKGHALKTENEADSGRDDEVLLTS